MLLIYRALWITFTPPMLTNTEAVPKSKHCDYSGWMPR